MTTEPLDPLAMEFASSHPEELAGALTGESLPDLGDFIARLPVKVAAPVLTRLPSWQLTGLLGHLEPQFIGRLLMAAAQDDAVAICSHLRESLYPAILAAAPAAGRQRIRQLLEYPSHSLAALVTTDFIRVEAGTLCGAFCEQLSTSSDTRPRPILVVDAQGRYSGMVSLRALYSRSNRARSVGSVANPVDPLSGMTSAESALSSRLWLRYTELPVVDLRHRLLGVVTRASLQRVAGRDNPAEFSVDRVVGELASGYLSLCGRLLESVLGGRR